MFRVNSGYCPESPALTMVWERVFVTIIYESVSQKKHWQVGTLRRNNFADVCITWKCCTQRIKSAVLRLNVQGKIYVQCGRYTNELGFKVSAHKYQSFILYLVENLLLNVYNANEILFWLNYSLPPLYALRGIFFIFGMNNKMKMRLRYHHLGVRLENGKYPTLRLFFVRFDIDTA